MLAKLSGRMTCSGPPESPWKTLILELKCTSHHTSSDSTWQASLIPRTSWAQIMPASRRFGQRLFRGCSAYVKLQADNSTAVTFVLSNTLLFSLRSTLVSPQPVTKKLNRDIGQNVAKIYGFKILPLTIHWARPPQSSANRQGRPNHSSWHSWPAARVQCHDRRDCCDSQGA